MVSVLTQVTVTFSKAVTGIEPTDLWANGNPAASVSGAGSTYTFVLERQPDYGGEEDQRIEPLLGHPIRFG